MDTTGWNDMTRDVLRAWGLDPDALTTDQFKVARIMVQADAEGVSFFGLFTADEMRIAREMRWVL